MPNQHAPKLGDGKVCRHLLQLAFHAGLGLVLHKHAAAAQHLGRQFGFAGAITAHGIQVHAGGQHVSGEDGGVALVGGDGGDDVASLHCRSHAGRDHHVYPPVRRKRCEIALQLGGGHGIHIKQLQAAHAQQRDKGQRLKFALRAIANQRHAAAVRPRQLARHHGRGGGGAQGGGQRQLAHKARAPVATSARAPKAITVGRPCWVLMGWPLTYLKA